MTRRPEESLISAGRRAQSKGKAFEQLIERSIKAQGLVIQHNALTARMIWTPHGTRLQHTKSALDFEGVLAPHGTAVRFDAKSVATPTRFDLKGVTRGQAKKIQAAHQAGGLAGLLVEFTAPGPAEVFWLPWPVLGPLWRRFDSIAGGGAASIPRGHIALTCPRVATDGKLLDLAGLFDRLIRARAGR